jgi:hypothetical protein
VEQIRNYFPTLKTTYPAISAYYSGSLLKKPIRWSPMAAVYLKSLSDVKFSLDGIAASEDSKLSYIITSMERSEYDALNTISQTRIRYLVPSS